MNEQLLFFFFFFLLGGFAETASKGRRKIRRFFIFPKKKRKEIVSRTRGAAGTLAAADLVVDGVNGQRGWGQLARHIPAPHCLDRTNQMFLPDNYPISGWSLGGGWITLSCTATPWYRATRGYQNVLHVILITMASSSSSTSRSWCAKKPYTIFSHKVSSVVLIMCFFLFSFL